MTDTPIARTVLAADAVNFSVDTRGWGDGAVKIALNLGGMSVVVTIPSVCSTDMRGLNDTNINDRTGEKLRLRFNETVSG